VITDAAYLLSEVERRGIKLRADGQLIRFQPKSAMTDELAASIRAHRADVLALLAAAVPPPSTPCWNCRGCRFFARPERLTWICVRCHPPSEPVLLFLAVAATEPRDA
jgi:hypothetical protein